MDEVSVATWEQFYFSCGVNFNPTLAMSSLPSIPKAEDNISSLPDAVLCHVLSFLPTKLAVATSILSKRWTTLWLSVPTLDVDEESFKSSATFRLFVYSVSRHPKLSLESLHIRCGKSHKFNPCDLNQLVLVAVQRGLQNFDLNLNMRRYRIHEKLAPTFLQVLSCKTLVVLKLKNLCIYDVPHLVHLPLLKTLHLKYIDFLDECVHLMNVLNGCPILEDLHIRCLNHLDRDCDVSKEEFKGFPSLVRANIFSSEPVFPFIWLYNAEFMRVSIGDHMQMSISKYRVPTFHNLTHMELIFYYEWHEMWVIHVLQHCPKLQNLIFVQVDDEEGVEVEWKETKTVPECLSSQLRTCSLKGFSGNQRELHFAEYIMLNSKILHTMTIESSNWVDEKAKYQILKKLYSYPRGSVTCKLLFD